MTCCVKRDTKVFLLLHKPSTPSGKPKWGLPGGFTDEGEGRYTALKREYREETNREMPKNGHLPVQVSKGTDSQGNRVEATIFKSHVEPKVAEEAKKNYQKTRETCDCGLFTIEEIKQKYTDGELRGGTMISLKVHSLIR